MQWIIYAFAAIGAALFVVAVVYPLLWVALYATGLTVFKWRTAGAEWRARWIGYKAHTLAKAWCESFAEGLRWPATRVTCGALSWEPLFKYKGFKRRK